MLCVGNIMTRKNSHDPHHHGAHSLVEEVNRNQIIIHIYNHMITNIGLPHPQVHQEYLYESKDNFQIQELFLLETS